MAAHTMRLSSTIEDWDCANVAVQVESRVTGNEVEIVEVLDHEGASMLDILSAAEEDRLAREALQAFREERECRAEDAADETRNQRSAS